MSANSLGFVQECANPKPAVAKQMGFVFTSFPPTPGIPVLVPVVDDDRVEVHRLWRVGVFTAACLSAVVLTGVSIPMYQPKQAMILPLLALVSLSIAFLGWLQVLLSMNLLQKMRISRTRLSTLVLYGFSALSYCVSAIAIMENNFVLQFVGSVCGAVLVWIAFISIFHGQYVPPTRQQTWSLVQIILLTLLWDARAYLISLHHLT